MTFTILKTRPGIAAIYAGAGAVVGLLITLILVSIRLQVEPPVSRDRSTVPVTVNGLNVDIPIDSYRNVTVCASGHPDRYLVRYDRNNHPVAGEFIEPTGFIQSRQGPMRFVLLATIRRPLEGDGWRYLQDDYTGCGLFSWLWPDQQEQTMNRPVLISR